ncbi:MAG: amidohydrolase [Omnitrophica WOR_2 bacterium]
MQLRPICLLLVTIMMTACNKGKTTVDLIVRNAVIYTADSTFTLHTTMAVDHGKIIAVGDDITINDAYQSDSVLDVKGKAVYPGFIDPHSHFYGYALNHQYADLQPSHSLNEMIEIVQKHFQESPSTWIVGRGWDQNNWPGQQFPDNKLLNEKFPEIPVVLIRVDGHAVLVNQAAIDRSGFKVEDLSKSSEAVIKRGKFTGIFKESLADSFRNLVPKPKGKALADLMMKSAKECFGTGLTMVTDAGADAELIDFYDSLQSEDEFVMSLYVMLNPTNENVERFVKKGVFQREKLNVRSIKLYADGALGSRGACLLRPYSDDPGNYGIMTITPEEIGKWCVMAYDNGYQINTHAIGDSANRVVLDVYSNYLLPGNDLRWRIEHAQVIDPNDISKFGEFSIIPSVQATHATSDMSWARQRLGRRIRNAYAYRQLMKQNGWIPNGTDFPIENINPVYTFYAAVDRKDLEGNPPRGFQRENALTRQEALRSITIWAAKACFEENKRGSLEVGKNADFVILDRDIMQVKAKDIPKAKVIRTYIDGKVVYRTNDL